MAAMLVSNVWRATTRVHGAPLLRAVSMNMRSNMNMNRPAMAMFSTKFAATHEYVHVRGKQGTIGISDFAQNKLGDVVYVDLPPVGETFAKGDVFGAVESVKAASDVYAPADLKVVAVNEQLGENPHLVNEEAMTGGWFIKVDMNDPSQLDDLMEEAAYKDHCAKEQEHDH